MAAQGDYERELYRQAGQHAVINAGNPVRMSPAQISNLAADAAVTADRKRMANLLRDRIMRDKPTLPPEISMKVDELLFDLAEQIETGMPAGPREDKQK